TQQRLPLRFQLILSSHRVLPLLLIHINKSSPKKKAFSAKPLFTTQAPKLGVTGIPPHLKGIVTFLRVVHGSQADGIESEKIHPC
ncbi:MAG: hypothetical protein NTZ09_13560, partial [Candidatus Hydrogenedentes bacterium]|nr:hypothetical protein [Candidatus Hydrogenedentota bacterium]